MKKRVSKRTFSRKAGPRKALQKSLLRSLVLNERIETTLAKAKEISPAAEKLITRAGKGGVATRRRLVSLLGSDGAKKLMDEVAPRYKDRKGGYTRILKLAPRSSDQAKRALIEFI
ncbi:MAG: 50S ribosomal protein L17 [bacterium]|nr:50S ribosomal protein L17 [bacterium]